MSARADDSSWWRRKKDDITPDKHVETSPRQQRADHRPQKTNSSSRSSTAASWLAPAGPDGPQAFNNALDGSDLPYISSSSFGERHSNASTAAAGSSGRVYSGAHLTARLRSADAGQKLKRLLEDHAGTLNGQQLSAAFKGLAVMDTSPAAVQDLAQNHLLPMLDTMVRTALSAAAGSTTSNGSSATTETCSRGTTTTTSSSSNRADGRQQETDTEVLMDGRACAVIMTSLLAIFNAVKGARQARQEQRSLQADILASAHSVFKLFLSPAVLATATPQAFGMLAASAAKLHLQSISQRQLRQLLDGLLAAAAAAQSGGAEANLLHPPHVSQTLWGVATLLSARGSITPMSEVQQSMCDGALLLTQDADLYAAAKPVELVNTLSAFVISGAKPPKGLVRDLIRNLGREVNLRRAIPQDLGRSLWTVARLDSGLELRPEDCMPIIDALCRPEVLQRAIGQDVANLLWGVAHIQELHQQQCKQDIDSGGSMQLSGPFIRPDQLQQLAAGLVELSDRQRVTLQDLPAVYQALVMLDTDLPDNVLSQLFALYMKPHILDPVAGNLRVSMGIVNIIWAVANFRARRPVQPGACSDLMTDTDIQTLTDMLTEPARVRHLTAADISIAVHSLALLGRSLNPNELTLLLQRFLEPSTQKDVQPQNFQNVCWGIVRMRQHAVLQQEGLLQRLLQAYLAAGDAGGAWAGKDADATATANILWAVAQVCKGPDTHEKRWVELRAKDKVGKARSPAAAAATAAADDGADTAPQHDGDDSTQHLAAAAAAAAVTPELPNLAAGSTRQRVSSQVLQRLFDSFMQHRALATASPVDISVALWAAAVLNLPLAADDLQWLLSAFMQQERLEAASAESISNIMYAVAHLLLLKTSQHQQQQERGLLLQQPWRQQEANAGPAALDDTNGISLRPNWGRGSRLAASSSSALGLPRGRPTRRGVLNACSAGKGSSSNSGSSSGETCAGALITTLAKLTNQLVQHIPDSISSQDITVALLSLAKAGAICSNSKSSVGQATVRQLQGLLQTALWQLLKQLLLLVPGNAPPASPSTPPSSAAAAAVAVSPSRGSSNSKKAQAPWQRSGVVVSSRQQQSQQQRLATKHMGQIDMQVLVDAVWASDIVGVANTTFLEAVTAAAIGPSWGPTAAAAGSTIHAAVQSMPWADVVCLLEKLASLNHLTPDVWHHAVQPLLKQPGSWMVQQQQQQLEQQLEQHKESYWLLWGEAAGFVSRLCWAAAAGNCQESRDSVVLLCKHLLSYLQSKQQQQQQAKPQWGATNQAGFQKSSAAATVQESLAAGTSSGGSSDAAVFDRLDSNSLCQLWQVHMWLQDTAVQSHSSEGSDACTENSGLRGAFSAEQLQLCEAAWKDQVQHTRPSRWQKDIAAVLRSIPGVSNVRLESLTADGCFSVDITATVTDAQAVAAAAKLHPSPTLASPKQQASAGKAQQHNKQVPEPSGADGSVLCQLAVEADGPSHFVLTGPDMADVLRGEAQMRTRSLAARGFVVLRVGYLEWEQQQQDVTVGEDPETAGNNSSKMAAWLAGRVSAALSAEGAFGL